VSREISRRLRDSGAGTTSGRSPSADWQALQDLFEDEADIAAHEAVLVPHTVTELALLVAVRVAQIGEVPHVAGVDLSQVERVLASVEAKRDDDVVLRHALPQVHRDVVSAE
jgi:hypothetical protein